METKQLRIVPPPGGAPPPPVLACTRFNNKTWQEYQTWLNANQETYEQIYHRPLKCIYGSPREISPKKIPLHAKILVIEMNNDENKIEGIGEIIRSIFTGELPRPTPDREIIIQRRKTHETRFRNNAMFIYEIMKHTRPPQPQPQPPPPTMCV